MFFCLLLFSVYQTIRGCLSEGAKQIGKMIFDRAMTLFHETFIHAELFAQDYLDNNKVDYSNIRPDVKIPGYKSSLATQPGIS